MCRFAFGPPFQASDESFDRCAPLGFGQTDEPTDLSEQDRLAVVPHRVRGGGVVVC